MKYELKVITGNYAELQSLVQFLHTMDARKNKDKGPTPQPEMQQPVQQQPTPPMPEPQPEMQQPVQQQPTPAPTTGEVDANGMVHDDRIHAKSKGKNADGTWRRKRKLDENFIAQVEAELKANAAPPVQQPQPQPEVQQPVQQQPTPPMPTPQPEVQQQPAPVMPTGQIDFNSFMPALMTKTQERGADGLPVVSHEYIGAMVAEISAAFNTPLAAITDIANNQQMIDYAVTKLTNDGKWG